MTPFHLAFPVTELERTREFYCDLLGCDIGRESSHWIDFDFFGHQVTAHVAPGEAKVATNAVDGEAVPVRHFGAVLAMEQWQKLVERLRQAGVDFLIEPQTRFAGKPGEQATFFIQDPSGNALEFKALADPGRLFAKQESQ
ncbi:MAG: glyoxalase [Gammaproteobacteria bacterium]|nr:glyoxalase [Gammaproteobacteria bacterium]